jgi:hypothetical protein
MNQNEIDEILDHINTKVAKDVPSIVKMIARKKLGSFQSFDAESLPESLRNCSVEELISIVKQGLDTGKLKI